jgi:hypothetical protein
LHYRVVDLSPKKEGDPQLTFDRDKLNARMGAKRKQV